jgi:MFS family permease
LGQEWNDAAARPAVKRGHASPAGRSPEILRATGLLADGGRSLTAATSVAILLYAGHNAVAAVSSLVAGQLCDQRSPRLALILGAMVYVASYGLLAAGVSAWPLLLGAFALAGVGIGFAETAESTAVAQALPEELRGNGYGALGLTQALGDLGSTAVAGILWALLSPAAAFLTPPRGWSARWSPERCCGPGARQATAEGKGG